MRLFTALHRMGTAVVLATHSQDLLHRHGFPVLRMEGGRLHRDGDDHPQRRSPVLAPARAAAAAE
jgi:ABC-type ATPase involved in cell division